MTEAPAEPTQEPSLPGDDVPDKPTVPDLPDPAFPEVLPGGEDAPEALPE